LVIKLLAGQHYANDFRLKLIGELFYFRIHRATAAAPTTAAAEGASTPNTTAASGPRRGSGSRVARIGRYLRSRSISRLRLGSFGALRLILLRRFVLLCHRCAVVRRRRRITCCLRSRRRSRHRAICWSATPATTTAAASGRRRRLDHRLPSILLVILLRGLGHVFDPALQCFVIELPVLNHRRHVTLLHRDFVHALQIARRFERHRLRQRVRDILLDLPQHLLLLLDLFFGLLLRVLHRFRHARILVIHRVQKYAAERVVIGLRNRIVFVVVAARARHG